MVDDARKRLEDQDKHCSRVEYIVNTVGFDSLGVLLLEHVCGLNIEGLDKTRRINYLIKVLSVQDSQDIFDALKESQIIKVIYANRIPIPEQ